MARERARVRLERDGLERFVLDFVGFPIDDHSAVGLLECKIDDAFDKLNAAVAASSAFPGAREGERDFE